MSFIYWNFPPWESAWNRFVSGTMELLRPLGSIIDHGTSQKFADVRTHLRKVSKKIWKREPNGSLLSSVNSLKSQIWHPAFIEIWLVANHENRSLVLFQSPFPIHLWHPTSKWLVGSSSTKTLFSRFIKRDRSVPWLALHRIAPGFGSRYVWWSKPQRARAARTSAWLRAGKAFQTASSGVWRCPLRPLAPK